MKACMLLCVIAACGATPAPAPVTPLTSEKPEADKLEMKAYVLVLLRRGPAWTPETTPETQKIFEGHMANIEAMARTGKLIIAGPIDADVNDRTAIAGIFIFNATRAEVDEMIARDPAIEIKRLVPEMMSWFGPANIDYPGKHRVR